MNESKIVELCRNLAKEYGQKAFNIFKDKSIDIKKKKDGSLLSEWDGQLEQQIRSEITKKFPDHSIIGEELEKYESTSEYSWIIDPIDGTSNFSMRIPLFGSMIAVLKNGNLFCSAVSLPSTNTIFWVNSLGKCLVNDTPFKAGLGQTLKASNLIVDKGRSENAQSDMARLIAKSNLFRSERRFGNMCAGVAGMLSGKPTVHIVFDANQYDLAPAACLYKAAGFSVKNRHGKEWSLEDRDLVVAHPNVIDEVVQLITELN